MRREIAVMALLCLLNFGCAEIKNSTSTAPPPAVANENSETKNFIGTEFNIQTLVQPTTKPERYMVYFSWPTIDDDLKLRIRQNQLLALVLPNQTTFSHEVDHDKSYTYTFEILDQEAKVQKTYSKVVLIPRDFVVRANTNQFLMIKNFRTSNFNQLRDL